MNLWQTFLQSNCTEDNAGFSLHFDAQIDPEIRSAYLGLAKFLRSRYCFPVHVNIYVKNCEKIRLRNGQPAYGSFRWFSKRPPNIRIPSKMEEDLLRDHTREEIIDQILSSLIHEMTHYFQWVLDLDQSSAVSERQANYYRYRILDEAAQWYGQR